MGGHFHIDGAFSLRASKCGQHKVNHVTSALCWYPAVVDGLRADFALVVDVGVVSLGHELDLWRLERILIKVQVDNELSSDELVSSLDNELPNKRIVVTDVTNSTAIKSTRRGVFEFLKILDSPSLTLLTLPALGAIE